MRPRDVLAVERAPEVLLVGSRLPESLYRSFSEAYVRALPRPGERGGARLTAEVSGAEEVTFRAPCGAYVRFGVGPTAELQELCEALEAMAEASV